MYLSISSSVQPFLLNSATRYILHSCCILSIVLSFSSINRFTAESLLLLLRTFHQMQRHVVTAIKANVPQTPNASIRTFTKFAAASNNLAASSTYTLKYSSIDNTLRTDLEKKRT